MTGMAAAVSAAVLFYSTNVQFTNEIDPGYFDSYLCMKNRIKIRLKKVHSLVCVKNHTDFICMRLFRRFYTKNHTR